MSMKQQFWGISLLVFLAPSLLCAYNPIKAEPSEPYAVIPLEGDLYVEHHLLGDLSDYPDMYEFTTDVAVDLKIRLRQRDSEEAVPFGLILVRQNDADGGVTEVLRQNQSLNEWQTRKESSLGITFLENSTIEESISPGTYRLEVSTPDNRGAYMLILGDEPVSSGFFASLAHIFSTQRHFGYSPFHVVLSSYVYYPIGIVMIAMGVFLTYRYRTLLRHA